VLFRNQAKKLVDPMPNSNLMFWVPLHLRKFQNAVNNFEANVLKNGTSHILDAKIIFNERIVIVGNLASDPANGCSKTVKRRAANLFYLFSMLFLRDFPKSLHFLLW